MFSLFSQNGLNRWSKQIEDSVFLINGQVRGDDTELLEGQVSTGQFLCVVRISGVINHCLEHLYSIC